MLALSGTVNATDSFIGVGHTSITDVSGNQIGTPGAPLDPQLQPLNFYGGPTRTRLPKPGSPVLDLGSDPGGLGVDQRGFGRPVGGGVDIGAVERQANEPIPVATATSSNVTVAGGTSQSIVVTFEDLGGTTVGLDASSIDGNDFAVRVLGPGGFDVPATFVSIDDSSDGSPRTATYTIIPPEGPGIRLIPAFTRFRYNPIRSLTWMVTSLMQVRLVLSA